MSKPENRPEPTFDFKKCCGKCAEAKKAARDGTPVEPHKPCEPRPAADRKPSAPKPE